jgi:uncharacterized repeat protein (TIGR03803 family)
MRNPNSQPLRTQISKASLQTLSIPIVLAVVLTTIFVVSSAQAQTYSVVYNFAGAPDGATPNGRLMQDAAGNFYGVTRFGGAHKKGTIFKLDTSGTETVLYSFTGKADGASPVGLYLDTDGTLYGTADSGGDLSCKLSTTGCGTVFKLSTGNVLTVLHTFSDGSDGAYPNDTLVSINGVLYGTADDGASTASCGSCGLIFKVTKGGTFSVVYAFTGGTDGYDPQDLIRDAAGNLYGAAASGGSGGYGVVFEYDTAGNLVILYSFDGGTGGGNPEGRIIRDVNGNIHGTTYIGGSTKCTTLGCGVLYRLDTAVTETVLHTFTTNPDGVNPLNNLLDVSGSLYGTTYGGGDSSCSPLSHGCGVLFEFGNTGEYSVIHSFTGGDDGGFVGDLTLGADGSIYGTTQEGGTGTVGCSKGCGVIFKYMP